MRGDAIAAAVAANENGDQFRTDGRPTALWSRLAAPLGRPELKASAGR